MGNSITLFYSTSTRILTSVKNSATNAVLLTLSYDNGLLTSVTDNNNRRVNYSSSAISGSMVLNTVSQMGQSSATPPVLFSYTYQSRSVVAGQTTTQKKFLASAGVTSATGTGTASMLFEYDADNRVTKTTDATGNTRTFVYSSTTGTQVEDRDANGTLIHSWQQNFDGSRRATGATDGAGKTSVMDYGDANNARRPTSVTTPDGKISLYTYDSHGNVLTSTTTRGLVTYYTYDYSVFRLGRLISVKEGNKPATTITYFEPSGLVQSVTAPSPTGTGTVTSTFTYDALGNPLTVIAPGNNAAATVTTTFNYTQDGAYTKSAAMGQPIAVTDALGRVTHMRYDALGRVISTTDNAGITTSFAYNLAGQVTTATLPPTGQSGSGSGSAVTDYLYVGGPATSSKVYDEAGTLIRESSYTYDASGRTLSVTGSAEAQRFEYDGAGRLVRLFDGNDNLLSEYVYSVRGLLATERKPHGRHRSRAVLHV